MGGILSGVASDVFARRVVAPGAPSVPRSPVNACFLVVAALTLFALGAARGDAQLAVCMVAAGIFLGGPADAATGAAAG